MKLTRSCHRSLAILAAFALVAALGAFAATPAAAQPDAEAAALCSEHHGFGAQPVDIAKSADGETVLAQVNWGYSAPGGFCYLVLDDDATETLRANADQLPDPSSNNADPQAAARCSQHHGFGAQPVDVAKTADRTRVLAQVQWGYSAPGGFCYLTLNPAATQTLRNTDADTDDDETDDTDDDTDQTDDTDDDTDDETGDDTDDDETDDTDDDTDQTDDTDDETGDDTDQTDDDDTDNDTPTEDPQIEFNEEFTPDFIVASAPPDDPRDRFLATQGDITVKLHFCMPPESARLVSPDDVATVAKSWNEREAPFYTWQSSGLLNLQMEAGNIIESRILEDRDPNAWGEIVPPDCIDAVAELPKLPYGESFQGVIHHFIVDARGFSSSLGCAGLAYVNGLLSTTYIDTEKKFGMNLLRFDTSNPAWDWTFFVASHEIDHNIGIHHLNGGSDGGPYHGTRYDSTEDRDPYIVGIFAEFPPNYARRYQGLPTYPCYEVQDLGWPMGVDKPACARIDPPKRQDFNVQVLEDDRIHVSWGGNSFPLNTEEVSGYKVQISPVDKQQQYKGHGETIEAPTMSYPVDADATSFTIPQQALGFYKVTLLQCWALDGECNLGVGPLGIPENEVDITVKPEVVKVAQRPSLNIYRGDGTRNPIQYDLEWEPAPQATEYRIYGFGLCGWTTYPDGSTSPCQRTQAEYTYEPRLLLSESDYHLVEGEVYDIIISACFSDSFSSCEEWATTTIKAERSDSVADLTITPLDWPQIEGPVYQFDWQPLPNTERYLLYVGECPDISSPCYFHSMPTLRILIFYPQDVGNDPTMGIFEYGKQYYLELAVCAPGGWQNQDCPSWTSTTFTTPTRAN